MSDTADSVNYTDLMKNRKKKKLLSEIKLCATVYVLISLSMGRVSQVPLILKKQQKTKTYKRCNKTVLPSFQLFGANCQQAPSPMIITQTELGLLGFGLRQSLDRG